LTARDKILTAIKNGKPSLQPLPLPTIVDAVVYNDSREKFIEVFSGIGGQVVMVNGMQDIQEFIAGNFEFKNIISSIPSLQNIQQINAGIAAHDLENIDLAILPAEFGVAENGAVWLTEAAMQIRVLPFICQQLAVVLSKENIVSNMQQAYDLIGNQEYGFAAFIAGPSKTADIEQSLVLGAHGPKDMIIFLY
jgi:L-lactate dehydrogenase complex protein LldG